ncbi:MAG: hypothetical protein NTW07_00630, partial [candidate division Zixibacteria bacterium]|nr:hypothetical protein [candidate division Zixibacteria bacterium]
NKVIPLSVGLTEFDYVPGAKKWYEAEQLGHNKYFIQFQVRKQDWGFLHFDKDLRFDFRPKSRQSGQFEWQLEGDVRW